MTPPPTVETSNSEVPGMDEPVLDLPIAVIVVVPIVFPRANPAGFIAATTVLLDCQVTLSVMSTDIGAVV